MSEADGMELEEKLKQSLGALGPPGTPPSDLEDRVVEALHRRGLLRAGPARRWAGAAMALAASLILFSGGLAVGFRLRPQSRGEVSDHLVEVPKNRYVLFLYGGDAPGSPAYVGGQNGRSGEEQARISEYSA